MANQGNTHYGDNQAKSSPGRNDDRNFGSGSDRSQNASSRSGAAWGTDSDKSRQTGGQSDRQQNDAGRQGNKNDR